MTRVMTESPPAAQLLHTMSTSTAASRAQQRPTAEKEAEQERAKVIFGMARLLPMPCNLLPGTPFPCYIPSSTEPSFRKETKRGNSIFDCNWPPFLLRRKRGQRERLLVQKSRTKGWVTGFTGKASFSILARKWIILLSLRSHLLHPSFSAASLLSI